MHTLIYAIVPASTTEEAMAEARAVFDRLVGATPHSCPVFDYYVTFDDTDSRVAGPARWGALPTAAPLDSTEGQALLDRGWEATTAEFKRNLERVTDALDDHDVEAIMSDSTVRYAFHQLGAYRGPAIALYDEHADGIRTPDQLQRLREDDPERWIVPADVHF